MVLCSWRLQGGGGWVEGRARDERQWTAETRTAPLPQPLFSGTQALPAHPHPAPALAAHLQDRLMAWPSLAPPSMFTATLSAAASAAGGAAAPLAPFSAMAPLLLPHHRGLLACRGSGKAARLTGGGAGPPSGPRARTEVGALFGMRAAGGDSTARRVVGRLCRRPQVCWERGGEGRGHRRGGMALALAVTCVAPTCRLAHSPPCFPHLCSAPRSQQGGAQAARPCGGATFAVARRAAQ